MSRYELELQLQKQAAAALAAGCDNRGDREDTGAAMFGGFAAPAAPSGTGTSFEEAVALAKEGGWPVVIHQAGEWAICDAGGSCQIRRDMADRDDPREYWA